MFNFKNRIKKTGKATAEYAGKIIGVKEIKGNANWIAEMGKTILTPKYLIARSRIETFNQAQARLGVTNEDVARNQKMFTIGFYISFFFALFCFVGAIYNFNERTYIGVLSMLAIMVVCLANCFKFSFRVYQIKTRTLCSASEWYANKSQWFPGI